MTTVISVKFRGGSRLYYFSPGELEINAGDGVIVETARGTEYGDVMVGIHDVPDDQVIQPLKEVIRVATDRDGRCETATAPRKRTPTPPVWSAYRPMAWT